MKYARTLLKTLAILGPMAIALSAYTAEPAHADDWWSSSHYYDPTCAYPYYDYGYPSGDFFFGDDHRFHRRYDHHGDHHFDHYGPGYHGGTYGSGGYHGGFNHGGFNHGGFAGGGSGTGMFIPGSGGHSGGGHSGGGHGR